MQDAKFLFRLYMASKQIREAERTAIIIARGDQLAGKASHPVMSTYAYMLSTDRRMVSICFLNGHV